MRKTLHVLFALVIGLALGASTARAQSAPKGEGQKEEAKAAPFIQGFKLEYSLFELENGKRVNSRNYVVFVTDDGHDAHLKTGSRVPVATATGGNSSLQYIDVGVNIRSTILQRDGGMFLYSTVESNGIAPEQKDQQFAATPVIRSLEARACNAIVLGKPMLVSRMDDSASSRRYEVEVIVTKQ